MATDVPEGEQYEAPEPPDGPNPASSDPGSVPLVPHPDPNPLPGQLETAPDGSIRPAPAAGGSHEFAPPAPGLLDEPLREPAPSAIPPLAARITPDLETSPLPEPDDPLPGPGLQVPSTPDLVAADSPAWAIADDPPAADDPQNDAERATWPTVEPHDSSDAPVNPSLHQHAPDDPAAGQGGDQTPAAVQADVPDLASDIEPAPTTIVRPPEDVGTGDDMYDVPLGTLVYRSGLLGADQIESALAESERIGKRLGEVLIDNKMIDERDLGRLLAGQKGLPFLDLGQTEIEADATKLLPAASARIYCALPIAIQDGTPVVAVSDPTNGLVVEGVRRAMGGELMFAVATRSDLQRAIASNYGDDGNEAAADDGPEPHVQPSDHDQPTVLATPSLKTPAADPVPVVAPADIAEPEIAAPTIPAPETTAPDISVPEVATPDVAAEAPLLEPPATDSPASPMAPLLESAAGTDDAPATIQEETVSSPNLADDAASAVPLMTTHGTPPVGADPAEAPLPVAEKTVRVVIRLSDGDQVDGGAFATREEAIERAKALIGSIEAGSGSEWPFLNGRFLRPETIVSVDLAEERPRF